MAGNKTLTILKPDVVEQNAIGPVLTQITAHDFRIRAMRYTKLSDEQARGFYEIHKDKSFFENLIKFMTSGPVVLAILEKDNAVEDFRKLIGPTDSTKAEQGTIRHSYGTDIERNAVHGSDSDENAERECNFFFSYSERY
ncbi:MAG: nucleoside-diphosphate kinase [Bacteroidales bacterium]|nr:nucleoside-diphosphate kinase [Bacteroidales bacterium]